MLALNLGRLQGTCRETGAAAAVVTTTTETTLLTATELLRLHNEVVHGGPIPGSGEL